MGRTGQEPSGTTPPQQQPPSERGGETYQPPEVAWEEEFAPVADSYCIEHPLDDGCQ